MSSKRYPEEFKIETVKQITERGYPVAEVAARIGVSQHSLYEWLKRYGVPEQERLETQSQSAEIRKLKAELRRVTEERDILKRPPRTLPGVPVRYAFIRAHEEQHPVRRLCQMMVVHPSGYYAWKSNPTSARKKEDQRLSGLIKAILAGERWRLWLPQDYRGSPRSWRALRQAPRLSPDEGEGLRSQTGYQRRSGRYSKPSVVAPNQLEQRFDVEEPNQAWVTDITYIRTHEGWLYLAVVIDLFSRQVIGWSMMSRMDRDLLV